MIWGSTHLRDYLKKSISGDQVGESWELSAVQGNLSVVAEGYLKGNNIQELIEVYMGDLVGDKVYERFGMEFPLLIKFIDANDDLSVQVHPDDEYARVRHKAYGKTEMWYIMHHQPGARLISGFKRDTSATEFKQYLEQGRMLELLNQMEVKEGDVFFIPAGRIHAIGKGIIVAEIQQTSDITYRVYDWDRKDAQGKSRELHTEHALNVLDYSGIQNSRAAYVPKENTPVKLVSCPYFHANKLDLHQNTERDYSELDSFTILICTKGSGKIQYQGGEPVSFSLGDTILIPAELQAIEIHPQAPSSLLEVYIP